MYDVVLPGVPTDLIQCPLCRQRPLPRARYGTNEPRRWQKLLEERNPETINAYLVEDRSRFQHGDYNGGPCPVRILPGPSLIRIAGVDARAQAEELMRILGLA
ncbi:hypothetical protein OIE43_15990 [Streptomyces pseudovenezuelae]|uniref:Thioredoxin n=1 Tax=Streptomyces pseudovenezuelae TaxID=67350 RepID=A0ABZ1X0W3_9ACTN|nr:hypothetical protein [Streptomyces pseudovenezuelae]